jgi:hypothetical protein
MRLDVIAIRFSSSGSMRINVFGWQKPCLCDFFSFIGLVLDELLLLLLLLYSPSLGLGRFFSFLILYTVGRISWTGDQPVARPLSTHGTAQTQNKCTQYRHS